MAHSRIKLATAFMAMMAVHPPPSAADPCIARSGQARNVLVELYTSEGCSSCPPADRWLASLAPRLGDLHAVPVAFHVDYWDGLGWRDAFADPRFTARQRAVASMLHAHYVYTPQVLVGGVDVESRWRGPDPAVALGAASMPRAGASIEIARDDDAQAVAATVKVDLPDRSRREHLQLVAVLTESHLGSDVRAGENRGSTLRHEFVARDMATFPLAHGNRFRARFPRRGGWKPADIQVVAFVQDTATGEVLQALSSCSPTT